MARIGRQIPHFESIDLNSVEAVFSKDRVYRYLLTMKYADNLLDTGREKSVAVIMKNPSAADERMADATIRKVETFIHRRFNDIRTLHILNIFAYRATEPADLNRAFEEGGPKKVIGEENDRMIENYTSGSDYVIVAWGNNSGINHELYEERIFKIRQLLAKTPSHRIYSVHGKERTRQPLHGLMWGYSYNIAEAKEYLKI